ncbi:hypothetical protein OF83DRAFT_898954 [Amylostereum chailletii]|nr:hypothetical protein OF83DRAFT_898954 [Amylostereum chailletii]
MHPEGPLGATAFQSSRNEATKISRHARAPGAASKSIRYWTDTNRLISTGPDMYKARGRQRDGRCMEVVAAVVLYRHLRLHDFPDLRCAVVPDRRQKILRALARTPYDAVHVADPMRIFEARDELMPRRGRRRRIWFLLPPRCTHQRQRESRPRKKNRTSNSQTLTLPSPPALANNPKLPSSCFPGFAPQLTEYTVRSCPSSTSTHVHLCSATRFHTRTVRSSEADAR